MSLRPIEPGCLALVTGAINDHRWVGKTVRVLRRSPEFDFGPHVPTWEVETSSFANIALEKNLLRIDGHDPVTSEEEQEVVA